MLSQLKIPISFFTKIEKKLENLYGTTNEPKQFAAKRTKLRELSFQSSRRITDSLY